MAFNLENENIKPNLYDKIYLFFFIVLPLVYSDKIVDPILIPRQLLLTFFVFIVGLLIFFDIRSKKLLADFTFLKLAISVFFASFIVCIVISFLQSIVIQESIYLLSKVIIEFVFFILTTFLLLQNKLNLKLLIKSVVVFLVITLLMSFFQVLNLLLSKDNFFENVVYVSSTFGIKNLLSSILFLCAPFCIYAFRFGKTWRMIAVFSALLSLLLIWLLQTKAVIIALIAMLGISVLYLFKNNMFRKPNLKLTLIPAVFILMVLAVLTFQNKQKFVHLFDKKSSIERLFIWDNSLKMVQDNFVLGVGAGNWQIHVPKYGLDNCPTLEIRQGLRTLQRPHNDFLWVFCEMGVLGLSVYICIFCLVLYYTVKLFIKFNSHEYAWLYLLFFATIVGYVIIALVDFPIERIEHQIVLFVIFSIITAHYFNDFRESKTPKLILKLPVFSLFFLVPVLLSFSVAVKRGIGEYHSQKIYNYEHNSNWQKLIEEADRAVNAFYVMDPMSAPIEWYKGVALFSQGKTELAKASFERAYSIHPYNIHVLNNLASCYESLREHDKAIEFYSKALHISSGFEEARLNLSAVYFNMKYFQKAFTEIDSCSVNAVDSKYKLFLPAILAGYLESEFVNQTDLSLKNKILAILSNKEKLVQLYFESKSKKVKFDLYVLKSLE